MLGGKASRAYKAASLADDIAGRLRANKSGYYTVSMAWTIWLEICSQQALETNLRFALPNTFIREDINHWKHEQIAYSVDAFLFIEFYMICLVIGILG